MNVAYGLSLMVDCFLMKNEVKKAIPILKDCKISFTEDGRDIETLWSVIWLTAAYCQADRREDALNEIREILDKGTNLEHAFLIVLSQAGPWFKDLQNDPQLGRQLGSLLDKAHRLSRKLPSIRRTLRRHAQSIQIPSAGLRIRAFGPCEVTQWTDRLYV